MAKTAKTAKTATKSDSAPPQDDAKKLHKKQAKQEAKLMLQVEDARKAVQKAEAKLKKAHSSLDKRTTHLHALEEQLAHLRPGSEQPTASAAPTSPDTTNGTYVTDTTPLTSISSTPAESETFASIPTNQVESQPPVEGRTDISSTSSSPSSPASSATSASSNTSETNDTDAVPSSETSTPDSSSMSLAEVATSDISATSGSTDSTPSSETPATPSSEEDSISIQSGGGSMPIVDTDEHAWPPPLIREEVAQAVLEEATHPAAEHESQG